MNKTSIPDTEFDLGVFIARHQRNLVWGGATIVVAGAGLWFWTASRDLKESRGEQALASAEQAFFTGAPGTAETDLLRVVQRYDGTVASVRASMLLAQSLYEVGKADEGVDRLRAVVGLRAARPFRAAVHALIAAGLENNGKFDEAAAAYGSAAERAPTLLDRESYMADQARALTSAGKMAEALKIWQTIAEREASPFSGEARLRVGELTAAAAQRS